MEYKVSQYNHFFEVDGNFYVYNILTTSLLELEKDVYDNLKSESLDSISDDFKTDLSIEGIIVDSTANEKMHFEYYYDSRRYGDAAKRFKLTLIPTYACNLACPYCFEGKDKNPKKMSLSYVDAVLRFMKNQIEECEAYTPIQEIMISFFGGEPLICKEALTYFSNEASLYAKSKNIDIIYDITTNLTLLDDDIIALIGEHGMEVQVTIDGTQEQHDSRRIYKNGCGTYEIIIANLQKLVNAGLKENITVRINIDENNVCDAEKMLYALKPYAGSIYFGYLMTYKGKNEDYQNECFKNECYASTSIKKLYDVYAKLGFDVPQEFGKKTPCQMNSQNTYVVDCNLDLYKCELVIGHKECSVGFLDEQGVQHFNGNYYKQMTYSPLKIEKCSNCKMLPMCGGGCPAREYVNIGRNDGDMLVGECMTSEIELTNYLSDYIRRNT